MPDPAWRFRALGRPCLSPVLLTARSYQVSQAVQCCNHPSWGDMVSPANLSPRRSP